MVKVRTFGNGTVWAIPYMNPDKPTRQPKPANFPKLIIGETVDQAVDNAKLARDVKVAKLKKQIAGLHKLVNALENMDFDNVVHEGWPKDGEDL